MAWIKFKDKKSEDNALFGLFIQDMVNCKSYIDGIHNVPGNALQLLDKNGINYQKIDNEEEIVKVLEKARKMSLAKTVED